MLADPALVEEGARTNREINVMSGADLERMIATLMAAATPRLPTIHKVLLDSYF